MKLETIAITNPRKKSVGGKSYEKVRLYSVTDESCILADRRMTFIGQQSDQLVSVFLVEEV